MKVTNPTPVLTLTTKLLHKMLSEQYGDKFVWTEDQMMDLLDPISCQEITIVRATTPVDWRAASRAIKTPVSSINDPERRMVCHLLLCAAFRDMPGQIVHLTLPQD